MRPRKETRGNGIGDPGVVGTIPIGGVCLFFPYICVHCALCEERGLLWQPGSLSLFAGLIAFRRFCPIFLFYVSANLPCSPLPSLLATPSYSRVSVSAHMGNAWESGSDVNSMGSTFLPLWPLGVERLVEVLYGRACCTSHVSGTE